MRINDLRTVSDTQLAHGARKGGRRRHHMGQGRILRRDRVEIEEDGTGNVPVEVLLARVALLRGQVPGGVDDHEAGLSEARGEPLRGDEMLLRFRHGPLVALVNKGLKKTAENKLQSERLLKRSLR
jgi:hypothetical protein